MKTPNKQVSPRGSTRRRTNDYYIITDLQSDQTLGRLLDISNEGFKIVTADRLSEASYECRLNLPRFIDNVKEISFQASLKWCHHNAQCDWFEAGLQIDHMTKVSAEILHLIIEDVRNNGETGIST